MDDSRRIKHQKQMETLLTDCGIGDPVGVRLLELGYKNGLFLDCCSKRGFDPTGLEVTPDVDDELKKRFPHLNLIVYDGGHIPLGDDSFDLIVSFQVLEHVQSLHQTLDECLRVLKPGGRMYHICPNYHSFYEGHYAVMWLPFFHKTLGRWYLKLRGRYTPYYESLNLVTPKRLRKWLSRRREAVTCISLGKREFLSKFTAEQIAKVNSRPLRGLLQFISKLPLVKKGILKAILVSNTYYPLTLIIRKNQ